MIVNYFLAFWTEAFPKGWQISWWCHKRGFAVLLFWSS